MAEVREGHRRVVPEALAPLVALNKSRLYKSARPSLSSRAPPAGRCGPNPGGRSVVRPAAPREANQAPQGSPPGPRPWPHVRRKQVDSARRRLLRERRAVVEVLVLRVLRALLVMRVVALPARLRRARPGAHVPAPRLNGLLREGQSASLSIHALPVQGAVVTLRAVVNLHPRLRGWHARGPVRRDLRAVDHEDRAVCIHRELLGFEVVLQEIQSPRAEALR